MRIAALTSGGKDSLFAAYALQKEGHEIKYFLTIVSENPHSYMFHHPNIHLTKMQSEAAGIPLITGKTKGEKEEELKDLEKLLAKVKGKVDGVCTGALYSEYQKARIDAICKKLGLVSLAPLWNIDLPEYWNLLFRNKFEVLITAVAAEGLGEKWLGRKIDKNAVEELKKISEKNRINIAGEGGEFETLVLDCPPFKKKIKILKSRTEWHGDSGTFVVEKAVLEEK